MRNLIGNEWKTSSTKEIIQVKNPYNQMLLDTIPNSSNDDINEAVRVSNQSRKYWSGISINERCEIMLSFRELVKKESFELAKLLTNETGKNISESKEEIFNLMELVTVFVEKARHMYGNVIPNGLDDKNNYTIQLTSRESIGIVVAILPFNFPVMTFARKVLAALIMGNNAIVKPSSKAPLTITKLVYLLRTAGVPEGVLQVVHGNGKNAGKALAMHPDIQLITFSGATTTGIEVMESAAKNLTRVLLELGGNGVMIVNHDADIDLSIEETIKGRLYNMGQSSFSTQKILIHKEVKSIFLNNLIKKISKMKYGDPMDTSNELSCIIDEEHAIKVEQQVSKLVSLGARIIMGGKREKNYYEPTILIDDIKNKSATINTEILGPVIHIIEFNNINEAIKIVNDSPYGLSSSIFTKNLKMAFKVAQCLKTGNVIINGSTEYRSNEMAYGGWKYSGLGAEGVSSTLEQLSLLKTTVFNNVLE